MRKRRHESTRAALHDRTGRGPILALLQARVNAIIVVEPIDRSEGGYRAIWCDTTDLSGRRNHRGRGRGRPGCRAPWVLVDLDHGSRHPAAPASWTLRRDLR